MYRRNHVESDVFYLFRFELHSLVLLGRTFTARTHYAVYIAANHPHSPRIPSTRRKKSTQTASFREPLPCETDSQEDIFPITTTLICPSYLLSSPPIHINYYRALYRVNLSVKKQKKIERILKYGKKNSR